MTDAPHRATLGDVPLGPLDGRYRTVVAPLAQHLSEAALNRARLHVEVGWLAHLATTGAVPGLRALTAGEHDLLRAVPAGFGAPEVAELAEIEAQTVHDVKAVEYYLRRRLAGTSLAPLAEAVHLFLTSEDVNNLAYALCVRDAVQRVWLPATTAVVDAVTSFARAHAGVPLLARTHGQAATPTTLGKELAVLARRLRRQRDRVAAAGYFGKLNGATGTYGAHLVAVPDTDWQEVSRSFVTGLGLMWNPLTTQIEPHDWQAELFAEMSHVNRVVHNLCTDLWTYISMGYLVQSRGQGSVGSSTMPHKVNPIRFENAEANLEISSTLLDGLGATLVTSRLQRDLTDSTTQRNIGVALGHSVLALDNVRRGMDGLDVDASAMARDLDSAWEVLGEAVQSVMRVAALRGRPGMDNPYERLRDLTRGRRLDARGYQAFVLDLDLDADDRGRLLALSPLTYTGLAAALVAHLEET